jgi:hypothetical protein
MSNETGSSLFRVMPSVRRERDRRAREALPWSRGKEERETNSPLATMKHRGLLERLLTTILSGSSDESNDGRSSRQLDRWNDDVEAVLLHAGGSPNNNNAAAVAQEDRQQEEDLDESSCASLVMSVSTQMQSALLASLQEGTHRSDSRAALPSTDNDNGVAVKTVLDDLKRPGRQGGSLLREDNATLLAVLRACQNFLRWYLQIYQAEETTMAARKTSAADDDDALEGWKTINMLELYLIVAEGCMEHPSVREDDDNDDNDARFCSYYASQLLFYSCYAITAATTDRVGLQERMAAVQQHLIVECNLLQRLLRLLCSAPNTASCLALVRNVHGAVSSFPDRETAGKMSEAQVDLASLPAAPWVVALQKEQETTTKISYKIAFREIVHWALSREPAFPGTDTAAKDRRSELVVEILRAVYAARADLDEGTQQLLVQLLELDGTNEKNFECHLATIMLLMDVPLTFTDYLLKENNNGERTALNSLLHVLEKQVTEVLEQQLVDDRAAAALIPTLATLQKFCGYSGELCTVAKQFIFPADAEENFQRLVSEQEEKQASGAAKNMSPLDAPEGTLRWKVIQLLTWPQSLVKRFTGELLWTLCGGNTRELVHRVGMGNALPLLGLKGVVQLPGSIYS